MLSQAVPRLTSVEIDDELAAMLRERFADAPSVEIVDGDATALTYEDEQFTGAACFTMLHQSDDELQDRLFTEVARVLRPGAALVASDSLGSDELRPTTRATPTTPSTRRRCRPAGGRGVHRRRRAHQRLRLGGHREGRATSDVRRTRPRAARGLSAGNSRRERRSGGS